MIKNIFYHPLFISNLWIILIFSGVKATEYFNLCAMSSAVIISIIVMNIVGLHIRLATKHMNNKDKQCN